MAQEEVGELSGQRQQALSNLNATLQQRAVLHQKKQARKEKSDNIKEMAAGDLEDADLIRLKKFLGVQVFVKALLRSRMEKVKAVYEPFEMAFLTIKSHTVPPAPLRASATRPPSSNNTRPSRPPTTKKSPGSTTSKASSPPLKAPPKAYDKNWPDFGKKNWN